jgi:hypothetical protein
MGDPFKAESWNGAMINAAVLNPLIKINIPADYPGGNFSDETQKVGPMLTTVILTDTAIVNNKITLADGKSVGTARIRVYPNFEPFKSWKTFTTPALDVGENVTCEVYKNFGTTDVGAITVGSEVDISNLGLGLEYVDFVLTLTKAGSVIPIVDYVKISALGGF